jgi:hypothetical protein
MWHCRTGIAMPWLGFPTGCLQPARSGDFRELLTGHQLQRICRAIFNTRRTGWAFMTQVAFMGSGFHTSVGGWRQNDLHRAERACDHAGFAADTLRLIDQNSVISVAYRTVWTAAGTGSIFTMVTGCRAALGIHFHDSNTGHKL